jgi:hypothetical protein
MSKIPVFLFIALLTLSSTVFETASSDSISTPSVPEFTLNYADHSYEVPSTTSPTFNPCNNQTTITTIPGYHVRNLTIDLTIKNQPIPPTIDGNTSYLLFWIRLKGHYGNGTDWIYPYSDAINAYPRQSNSNYTVISLPTSYSYGANTESLQSLQTGDKIDFQVRAILAYGYNYSLNAFLPVYSYNYESVATSDWSNTQTLTIGKNTSPSTVPPNTTTPSLTLPDTTAPLDHSGPQTLALFGFNLAEVVIIFLSIIAVTLLAVGLFFHKKLSSIILSFKI